MERTISRSGNGGFDCNICLQSADEPVTTLCGHIYCWSCIYMWLHTENQQETCPVCKGDISVTSLVPLYGHRISNSESEAKTLHMGMGIPPRPPPPYNMNAMFTSANASDSDHPSQQLHQSLSSQPFHHQPNYFPHFREVYTDMTPDMFFTDENMDSDANVDAADSHGVGNGSGNGNRRMKMQIDRGSLNRFTLILFCGALWYLVLYC